MVRKPAGNTGFLHIIQNDPEVPTGNLLDCLEFTPVIHHPYRDGTLPSVGEIGGLIVLGGAMGANDDDRHPFLSDLKQLITECVAARIPYLGICLGGQLLAAACGGRVVSHRWEELGIGTVTLTEEGRGDRLFAGLPEEIGTFQWHHDSFDLPPEGVLLASSSACPHQAFRVGVNAWGFQFHPEVTEDIIRDWCAWDASTRACTAQFVADFTVQEEQYRITSRTIMENFLKQ